MNSNDSTTATSPNPAPAWVIAHRSWEPGAQCTSCLSVLQQIALSDSIDLNPFQATQLDSLPSGSWSCLRVFFILACLKVFFAAWLCRSERETLSHYCLFRQEGSLWICSVSGNSWSYYELFTFLLKKLPRRKECFNLGRNCSRITSSWVWNGKGLLFYTSLEFNKDSIFPLNFFKPISKPASSWHSLLDPDSWLTSYLILSICLHVLSGLLLVLPLTCMNISCAATYL